MVKQKIYLLPENLGQLNNLNIGLELCVLSFLTDFYSSKLCVYFELIKLQLEHKFLYELLQMLLRDLQQKQIKRNSEIKLE